MHSSYRHTMSSCVRTLIKDVEATGATRSCRVKACSSSLSNFHGYPEAREGCGGEVRGQRHEGENGGGRNNKAA